MSGAAQERAAFEAQFSETLRSAIKEHLHGKLKREFREWSLGEQAMYFKRMGWWPEASDFADLAMQIFSEIIDEVVVDLRDEP